MMNMRKTIWIALVSLVLVACKKDDLPLDIDQEEVDPGIGVSFYYASDETGKFEIWHAQSGQQEQVTESDGTESWWPRTSPDKSKMLFYRSNVGGGVHDYATASLWIKDLSTGAESTLFEFGANNWKYQGLANWSADGQWITLAAADETLGKWQLYRCDAEGEQLERLSLRDSFDYLDPVFSADGKSIYCVSVPDEEGPDSENFEIFRLDLETREETRLTFNDTRDHHPDLNPEGNKLVYETMVDPDYLSIGKWALMELNLDTKEEVLLLEDNHLNFYPRYAADGQSIFYVRLNVVQFNMSVFKMDFSDGSTSRLISNDFNSLNVDPQ